MDPVVAVDVEFVDKHDWCLVCQSTDRTAPGVAAAAVDV